MRFNADKNKTDQHRDVADGVDQKAGGLAETGDQYTGYCRSDQTAAIGDQRGGGDGVWQILLVANELEQISVTHRQFDCNTHTQHDGQCHHVPNLDPAAVGQHGECDRLQHFKHLCCQHHAMTVEAVGPDTRHGRQQQHRDVGGKAQNTQQCCRTGQSVNQPADGELLYPVTNQSDGLTGGKKGKVSVAQRAQGG